MIVLMFHSLTSPVSIKSIRKWLLIIYHAVNRERENKSKRGMVNICLTSPFFCSIKRFKEMGNGLLRSNQPAVSLSNGLPVGIKEQKIKKNQNSGHPGQIQDASKPVLQNLIEMLQFQNHWPWMNKNKKKSWTFRLFGRIMKKQTTTTTKKQQQCILEEFSMNCGLDFYHVDQNC